MKPENDTEMLQRMKAGDSEAFAILVSRYSEPLYNLALRIVGDRDRAEDVLQESFIKVYEQIGRFRGESRLSTWLYRIVCNRALSECRRRSLWERFSGRERSVAADPIPEEEERLAPLRKALAELPAKDRALLSLFYFEELSVAEIAEMLNQSEANVKVRLHRLRLRLRKELTAKNEYNYE